MITAMLARWGLGWLLGPIGKGLALAAGALLVVHFIRADAMSDCRNEQLVEQLELERERRAEADRIASEARARADEAEAQIETLEGLTDEIISETGDSCAISDELRERLRSIE